MACVVLASQAAAQVTFYERQGFEGRSFTTEKPVNNFSRHGFNKAMSLLVVEVMSCPLMKPLSFGIPQAPP
ncbi:hypothetical protein ABW22_05845 [Thiobacillus denitrificans]|uniref:Uncharacterized protein n=2 Tax=Thiobacillus denitrificans TaxID=36861 RepID=A0A106BRC5_THIDE|nr:hypothetical protein ABW22_05845 [Thiobacillus denitrificans]